MLQTFAAILPLLTQPIHQDSIPATDTAVVRGVRSDFLPASVNMRKPETLNVFGLAGVLQENGVHIKQYGHTGLATLTMRGAEPQQMQILWNGIAIANPMAGMTDLNTMGFCGNEDLQLLQGGTSSLYGSGNVGGSLLLTTPVSDRNNIRVRTAYSDYGYSNHLINAGYRKKSWGIDNSSSWVSGPNHFRYFKQGQGSETGRMRDAAFYRRMQRNTISHNGKFLYLRLVGEFTANMRMPGFTLSGPAGGTLFDRSTRMLSEARYRKNHHTFSARVAAFRDFLRYRDTLTATDDTSRSLTLNAQAEWSYRKKNFRFMTGLDVQWLNAITEAYSGNVKKQFPAQWLAVGWDRRHWVFSANGRFEWQEKIPVFSATITRTLGNYFVRFSAGTSFRRPALNDLYWARNGNPDLKPEQGRMVEFATGWSLKFRKTTLDWKVNPYYRELKYPIIWLWNSGSWEAVNIYAGRYSGIQFQGSVQTRLSDKWNCGARFYAEYLKSSMVWNEGEMPLERIFLPDWNGHLAAFGSYGNFGLNINATYTGERFMTNDNSAAMPSYTLINSTVSYEFSMKKYRSQGQVSLAVFNLTNRDYQVMPGRPMPLRGVELSLKINWNQ